MGDSVRTNIRTYRDSFQGIGCGMGCMLHLAFLGILSVATLIWLVKIRAWELSVTVELPSVKNAEPAEEVKAP